MRRTEVGPGIVSLDPERGADQAIAAPILMVDDHPANLVALEAILRPLGQPLVRALSGKDALRELLSQQFAVILMDVQMPGIDGLKTAQLIKERERTRHIPIIFLTALSKDPSFIFQGYERGAVDYILKPLDPEILRSKVSVFVELFRQREQIRRQAQLLRQKEREELARRNEQRLRAVVDAMPQALLAMRGNGDVYLANRHWVEYTGRSLDSTRLTGFLDLVHPEDRPEAARSWTDALAEARAVELEVRLRRASDGNWRWHVARAVPELDEDGELTGFICTLADIDDRKRAYADAEQARTVAERANRVKDEFLATVSHELRTPLNAILGWARLLSSGQVTGDKARRAIETIERNAKVQTDLIEDLLDVSRIITGKLRIDLAEVDLRQVALAAVDAVRPAAEARGIALTSELELGAELVSGDAARLQQVLWNLLSNAIKFTREGGEVTLRARRAHSQVEVTVRDSGMGIAPEFLPYVFDRFRQADSSSTRTHGGLGLGLAIVRHLVELHGGEVGVESAGPGFGATFTVRLPVRAVALGADVGEPSVSRGAPRPARDGVVRLDGLRVLVVDDEVDAHELLCTVLGFTGAEVAAAASAEEAMAKIRELRPDVLVSDIGMPHEDGYSLIRRVRALAPEEGGRIPAVALTGFAGAGDSRRALSEGFQRHLPKPVEPSALMAVVAEIAGRR